MRGGCIAARRVDGVEQRTSRLTCCLIVIHVVVWVQTQPTTGVVCTYAGKDAASTVIDAESTTRTVEVLSRCKAGRECGHEHRLPAAPLVRPAGTGFGPDLCGPGSPSPGGGWPNGVRASPGCARTSSAYSRFVARGVVVGVCVCAAGGGEGRSSEGRRLTCARDGLRRGRRAGRRRQP